MPEEITRQEHEFFRTVLSVYPNGRYEFTRTAITHCLELWGVEIDDLRIAVVQHLQSGRRLFRKQVLPQIFGEHFFHGNVELRNGRDVYVELLIKPSTVVRIHAHNHHRFPVLGR